MMPRVLLSALLLLIGLPASAQDDAPAPPEPEEVAAPDPVDHVEAPAGAPGGDQSEASAPAEQAASGAPGGSPVAVGAGRNFLVVFIDEAREYADQTLIFSLGEGDDALTVALNDDGAPPDVDAGDGRSVAAMAGHPTGAGPAALRVADGDVLWSQEDFAVPAGMEQPSLRLEVGAAGVTGGLVIDPKQEPIAHTDQDTGSPFVRLVRSLLMPIALGLGGGVVLGLLLPVLRRKAEPALGLAPRPGVPWPPELVLPEPGSAACWQVPTPRARTRLLAAVARHAAQAGPVLLLPEPWSRAALAQALAGLSPVVVPSADRATAVGLAAAANLQGEGLVLVAGPDAVEPPEPGEPEDAPLDELVELSHRPVVLVIVAGEATPVPPSVDLVGTGQDLQVGERVVLRGARLVTGGS